MTDSMNDNNNKNNNNNDINNFGERRTNRKQGEQLVYAIA